MERYNELLELALASPWTLSIAVASGILLFVLMTRELVLWFFRISTLEKRILEVQGSLARIEAALKADAIKTTATKATALDLVEPPKPTANFPLQN